MTKRLVKPWVILFFIALTNQLSAQTDNRISTIDFVQVLDNNHQETIYYYQNNWQVLREAALANKYIHSYQLLETPFTEEAPFQIMLVTTYADEQQYQHREEHFKQLIDQKGGLQLMNEKQPGEFRQVIYNKEQVKHWK